MQKIIISLLIVLCSLSTSFAQFGINGGYQFNDAEKWKIVNGGNSNDVIHDFYENNMGFGIDYWFRLPNKRIEFTPELNYQNNKGSYQYDPLEYELSSTTISLFANTNFYVFDFKGDCHCPTFSKKGPELQKGLFFRISPGLSYFSSNIQSAGIETKGETFAFSIGAGAGIDFGISEFLTITPIALFRYYPTLGWKDISTIDIGIKEWSYPEDETSLKQIYLGLRLGFRFDYQ